MKSGQTHEEDMSDPPTRYGIVQPLLPRGLQLEILEAIYISLLVHTC